MERGRGGGDRNHGESEGWGRQESWREGGVREIQESRREGGVGETGIMVRGRGGERQESWREGG